MRTSLPASSTMEQVEQMEQGGTVPAVPVGGTGAIYISPVPSPATDYHLTLRPLPDRSGVPAIIRLRRALKLLLRSYGLRCIGCKPAATAERASDMIDREGRLES